MTHTEIQDLLEAYVDESLDRAARGAVDDHLAGCAECSAILDGIARVELGDFGAPVFDEKAMRRAVRSSLVRLAVNVVVIGLAAWLVATLVGLLVLQPLIVDRGDRAAAATQATGDVAVMFNPGAALVSLDHNSGIITRASTATVVIPVGAAAVDLGTVETRLGPFSFGPAEGMIVPPYFGNEGSADASEQLALAGAGTVATVVLQFDPPISLETAQGLADSPLDIRVVWAGFPTSGGEPTGIGLEPGGMVGYGTCDMREEAAEILSASGGSIGRAAFTLPSSIKRALDATRASIDNLLDHEDLIAGLTTGVTVDSVKAARDHLASSPEVRTLVATGPAPELVQYLAESAAASAAVYDIDFTNWYQPLCGR